MAAMRAVTAASERRAQGRVWAVHVVFGKGRAVVSAPCTFLHKGRIAALRRARKIERADRRKRTLGAATQFFDVQTQRRSAVSQTRPLTFQCVVF